MKKFAIPLQAFASFGICLGMAWMIFVVAGFNPAPPSATDLEARNPHGLSFAEMNSTAAALARDMIADWMPSPVGIIAMPVTGATTPTPSPMAAVTLRAVSTFAPTPTTRPWYSFLFPTKESDDPDPVFPTLTPAATIAGTKTLTASPAPTSTPKPSRTPSRTPLPTSTRRPRTPTPIPTTPVPSATTVPPTTVDPTTAVPSTEVTPDVTEPSPTDLPTELPSTEPPTSEPTTDTPDPGDQQGTPTP